MIGREDAKQEKQTGPCVIISEKWQKTNKLRKVGERSKPLMRSLRTHSKLQGDEGGTRETQSERMLLPREGEMRVNRRKRWGWGWKTFQLYKCIWLVLVGEGGRKKMYSASGNHCLNTTAPSRTADSSFQLPMALCSHLWGLLTSEPN